MGLVTEILKEVPLSGVLKEKVSRLETGIENVRAENASLKEICASRAAEKRKVTTYVGSLLASGWLKRAAWKMVPIMR